MKVRLAIILFTALISACETQLDLCASQLKQDPTLVNIGKILSPDDITIEMLSNRSYIAEGDRPAFTKWMLIEQRCLREEMGRRAALARYPEQVSANRAIMKFLDVKQDAYVKLLAGKVDYGTFYSTIRNSKNNVEAEVAAYEVALKERATSQKNNSSSRAGSTFKPNCPPSKYPIYGCGNSSSSSSSRNPPGSKDCTYKSGPYTWTKTINGFTCPATDSSDGYFGTLVR